MGGDSVLESELILWTAKWLGGKLWNGGRAAPAYSRRKPPKHLASHFQLHLAVAASEDYFFSSSGCITAFWLLCAIRAVVHQVYLSPQSCDQVSTECPKIQPTDSLSQTDAVPPPNRVHHSSQTEPFWKLLSRSWHQTLRTAQTTSLLLLPDSVASLITSL